MSQQTKKEYINCQRERYLKVRTRRERTEIIDEICRFTGLNRKYVIKLLNKNIVYRERRPRSPTYSERDKNFLIKLWRASNCICSKYLKSRIDKLIDESAAFQHIEPQIADSVRKISASTIERILKNQSRKRLWSNRVRKKIVPKNAVKDKIPCESGELVPAHELPPGYIQIDSVSLCGGNASGDYFWIASATDLHTQWVELAPSFNLCARHFQPALEHCLKAFPFEIIKIHTDNGPEFLNNFVYENFCLKWKNVSWTRSFPNHKNHNAHIEQKNGSVVRAHLGYFRFDARELQRDLERLCHCICEWNNYCRPCMMAISREKYTNGKGFRRRYDAPQTPAQRVLSDPRVPALQKDKIRKKLAILNSIELKEEIDKLRRKILNRQSEIHKQKSRAALVAADSVPSVPSGTLSTSSATTNVFSSPSQLFSANPFGVILNEE